MRKQLVTPLRTEWCLTVSCSLVVMMHQFSVHHADYSGVYQPSRVGMMYKFSSTEFLARAAFMHHDDKGRPYRVGGDVCLGGGVWGGGVWNMLLLIWRLTSTQLSPCANKLLT